MSFATHPDFPGYMRLPIFRQNAIKGLRAMQPGLLLVDDSLTDLQKCVRYTQSPVVQQRYHFVRRLSQVAQHIGVRETLHYIVPLLSRIAKDKHEEIRILLINQIAAISTFLVGKKHRFRQELRRRRRRVERGRKVCARRVARYTALMNGKLAADVDKDPAEQEQKKKKAKQDKDLPPWKQHANTVLEIGGVMARRMFVPRVCTCSVFHDPLRRKHRRADRLRQYQARRGRRNASGRHGWNMVYPIHNNYEVASSTRGEGVGGGGGGKPAPYQRMWGGVQMQVDTKMERILFRLSGGDGLMLSDDEMKKAEQNLMKRESKENSSSLSSAVAQEGDNSVDYEYFIIDSLIQPGQRGGKDDGESKSVPKEPTGKQSSAAEETCLCWYPGLQADDDPWHDESDVWSDSDEDQEDESEKEETSEQTDAERNALKCMCPSGVGCRSKLAEDRDNYARSLQDAYSTVKGACMDVLKGFLEVDKPRVRQAAGEALVSVVKMLEVDDVCEVVLRVVLEMAHADHIESKVAAVQLLHSLAPYMPQVLCLHYVAIELLSAVAIGSPALQHSAARSFGNICLVCGPDFTVQRMLPTFDKLSKHSELRVRQGCIRSFVDVLRSVPDRVQQETLLPMYKRLLRDSETSVRIAAYEILGPVLFVLGSRHYMDSDLLSIYTSLPNAHVKRRSAGLPRTSTTRTKVKGTVRTISKLLGPRDIDPDIVFYCAYFFPAVVHALGPKNSSKLLPALRALCRHREFRSRRSLSNSLHDIARVLGQDMTATHLLPLVNGFLEDQSEIRTGLIRSLALLLLYVRPDKRVMYTETLHLIAVQLENWRWRSYVAKQLPLLVQLFPLFQTVSHVVPTAVRLCSDPVAAVRCDAAKAIGNLFVRLMSLLEERRHLGLSSTSVLKNKKDKSEGEETKSGDGSGKDVPSCASLTTGKEEETQKKVSSASLDGTQFFRLVRGVPDGRFYNSEQVSLMLSPSYDFELDNLWAAMQLFFIFAKNKKWEYRRLFVRMAQSCLHAAVGDGASGRACAHPACKHCVGGRLTHFPFAIWLQKFFPTITKLGSDPVGNVRFAVAELCVDVIRMGLENFEALHDHVASTRSGDSTSNVGMIDKDAPVITAKSLMTLFRSIINDVDADVKHVASYIQDIGQAVVGSAAEEDEEENEGQSSIEAVFVSALKQYVALRLEETANVSGGDKTPPTLTLTVEERAQTLTDVAGRGKTQKLLSDSSEGASGAGEDAEKDQDLEELESELGSVFSPTAVPQVLDPETVQQQFLIRKRPEGESESKDVSQPADSKPLTAEEELALVENAVADFSFRDLSLPPNAKDGDALSKGTASDSDGKGGSPLNIATITDRNRDIVAKSISPNLSSLPYMGSVDEVDALDIGSPMDQKMSNQPAPSAATSGVGEAGILDTNELSLMGWEDESGTSSKDQGGAKSDGSS